ncbi:DUF6799 domain-containing protein [Desertivirga arenae]|uniref:DUF6799 domain-containing protein n=1 Tax=Desertivirga arenae TaxID=2810309 RepID=UPI001A96D9B6|nr:DUF6799 domain-containing protein [Pedobacter sp. SYSU D00823]
MKKVVAFIIPVMFLVYNAGATGLAVPGVETIVTNLAGCIRFQETHLLFKDGKVHKVENGESKELQKEQQLNNGTVVFPDGAYELKDKKRYMLSDGECLDMNGSHYLNQRMLNQKRPMSADELQKSRNQNGEKGGRDKQ